MSRATIRAAISAWLAPPNVTGINTVYRGFPTVVPGPAFFNAATPGAMSGCVAMVFIAGETETRKAFGGPTSGQKRVDYDVEIHLRYRSVKPPALGSDAGLEATDDFDSIVDALKTRIRSDRTAGSGNVWQWGEAELGGRYGELVQDGAGGAIQWGVISTIVTEWLIS